MKAWRKRAAWLLLSGLILGFAPSGLAAEIGTSPATVTVPAGAFTRGSGRAERERAYRLDEAAYGHSITRERKWYENEPRSEVTTEAFRITKTPISNAQYAAFLQETGHRWPDVDEATWKGYRLIHPYERTRRHAWGGRTPPRGRDDHPVVMVSYEDAVAYAEWLSGETGQVWRLPTEVEWEKAARGTDGRDFPWGPEFDATRLNSHDLGPFDTVVVGSFPEGASAYGVLDAAGQVYEWTSTPGGQDRYIVKGGSWDDKGCGVCRPAARHSRPQGIKHILVGFRLVMETDDSAE